MICVLTLVTVLTYCRLSARFIQYLTKGQHWIRQWNRKKMRQQCCHRVKTETIFQWFYFILNFLRHLFCYISWWKLFGNNYFFVIYLQNLLDNFNPGIKNLISTGRTLQKALHSKYSVCACVLVYVHCTENVMCVRVHMRVPHRKYNVCACVRVCVHT